MKIQTARFGELEIEKEKLINFPQGIPGFPQLTSFFVVEYKDPIKWLQSAENPDIAFIVTDPFALFPDYSFKLGDDVEKFLELRAATDAHVLVILSVTGNQLTANLKAPLIINVATMKGTQLLIDDERYAFKTPLPAQTKK